MNPPLKHRVEYVALRAVAGLTGRLPYRAALSMGCLGAGVAYAFSRRIRQRGYGRLKQVFGDSRSDAELHQIARTAWRNLVLNGVEALRTPYMTDEWLRRTVDMEQVERIRDLSARLSKGVVVAIPHMGNWELAGVVARCAGIPITTVMRRQKNLLTDAYLNRMRAQAGLEALPTDAASFRVLVRRLEEGRCVALLPDLRAKGRCVRVRFLHREAELPIGMAFFARQANVPIVPVCMLREGLTRHRVLVFDPIFPDFSVDRDADFQRMTQQVMQLVDDLIRAHPEQYFWFNKRWVLGEEPRSQTSEKA